MERSWGPSPALIGLTWAAGAGFAVWCVVAVLGGADPAGRLIAGVAAVGLLATALTWTIARPRLVAAPDGLTVRRLRGTRLHPWSRVSGVRVLQTRRLGRSTSLLAVEVWDDDPGDERLMLFGKLDLGADPEDVAAELTSRYRSR